MTNLTVRELKQAEWDRWDDWLAVQPWGSPFSSAWWLEANCRAFGGHPLLLGVLNGEQLVGGVALRIIDVGPIHAVRPSILYNPIVIALGGAQSKQEVLSTLLEDMVRRRLIVPALACTTDMVDLRQAVWHHWNLTVSWTVVTALKTWKLEDLSPAELNKTRKAHRADLTARVEPLDAGVLYDLMQASMTRQQKEIPLGREQLHVLLQSAGSHGMQVVVRDAGGEPLSAGFLMSHGTRVAYHIWSGTSPAGLTEGAAVAMYVGRLEQLKAEGYEYLDSCGASLSGLSDFKLSFGGTLRTHFAISREPLWYKAMRLVHVNLLWLKGILSRY
jgi:hypothetical protein